MVKEKAAPYLAAMALALPLFAIEIWSGFRIAQSDSVLSVIAPTEQPLSVRSPDGVWAMLLAFVWFALAYWRRRMTGWEAALVVLGGGAVLARLGNAWIYGLAMIVPLARQLSILRSRTALLAVAAFGGIAISAYTMWVARPPALPSGAESAAASATSGSVFADWRWAPRLQNGNAKKVFAGGGLASESTDFWVDYVRVTQGHERWAEVLERLDVGVVVLETSAARPAADLVRGSSDWRVTYDADGVLVATRASTTR
jgi:hypothetical protein